MDHKSSSSDVVGEKAKKRENKYKKERERENGSEGERERERNDQLGIHHSSTEHNLNDMEEDSNPSYH